MQSCLSKGQEDSCTRLFIFSGTMSHLFKSHHLHLHGVKSHRLRLGSYRSMPTRAAPVSLYLSSQESSLLIGCYSWHVANQRELWADLGLASRILIEFCECVCVWGGGLWVCLSHFHTAEEKTNLQWQKQKQGHEGQRQSRHVASPLPSIAEAVRDRTLIT